MYLSKISSAESRSPEGNVHFEKDGEHYLLTANKMSGADVCLKLVKDSRH